MMVDAMDEDMGNDLEAEIDDLRNEVESLKAKVFINEGANDGINVGISDLRSDFAKLDEEFHLSERDWHPFMGHVQHSGTTIEIGSGYVYAGGRAVHAWTTTSKDVSALGDGTYLMYMSINVDPTSGYFSGSYVPALKTVINTTPETVNTFTSEKDRDCGIIIGDFTMSGNICTGWRQRWSCDMYVPLFTFLEGSRPVISIDYLTIYRRGYYVATWHLALNESTIWSDTDVHR